MGTYLPVTRTLGWGACCGSGTPQSQDIFPNFYSCGCGAVPFCIHSPPTSLDGCGFFNSVVVRFPFILISDVPEWWLFYILVVILMWLCKGVSHVCLPCCLDWKPSPSFKKKKKSQKKKKKCMVLTGMFSWLGVILQSERSPVQFLVGAHAWVAGLVPSWGHVRGNGLMFLSHINVSLPPFLPPFPSLYK